MIVSRVPVQARFARSRVAIDRDEEIVRNQYISRLLEGELLDLYAAILIAVPVALFLKSLWF